MDIYEHSELRSFIIEWYTALTPYLSRFSTLLGFIILFILCVYGTLVSTLVAIINPKNQKVHIAAERKMVHQQHCCIAPVAKKRSRRRRRTHTTKHNTIITFIFNHYGSHKTKRVRTRKVSACNGGIRLSPQPQLSHVRTHKYTSMYGRTTCVCCVCSVNAFTSATRAWTRIHTLTRI